MCLGRITYMYHRFSAYNFWILYFGWEHVVVRSAYELLKPFSSSYQKLTLKLSQFGNGLLDAVPKFFHAKLIRKQIIWFLIICCRPIFSKLRCDLWIVTAVQGIRRIVRCMLYGRSQFVFRQVKSGYSLIGSRYSLLI